MKKLIAKCSILYQNRIYAPGQALPAADGRMTDAWLRAGSAAWQEDAPPAQAAQADQSEGAEMLTGRLDPEYLSGLTKAELADLAGEMGLDISGAKTKADLVALIGAEEVQAEDETQQNDEGTQ